MFLKNIWFLLTNPNLISFRSGDALGHRDRLGGEGGGGEGGAAEQGGHQGAGEGGQAG